MDETTNDTSEDFEFEPEPEQQQSQTAVVAPTAPLNGHAVPKAGPGQVINRQITEKYTLSGPPPSALMGRVNNRPAYSPEKARQKDDREFLEDFNLKAEAEDYQLSCTRTQPSTNSDGDPIPQGTFSKTLIPVMNYDQLVQRMIDEWGGGVYRVTFAQANGQRATDIQRAIILEIPTNQHPPKRERGEKIELRSTKPGVVSAVLADDGTEEAKRRKREHDDFMDEQRRLARMDEAEMAKAERELKKLKREREIDEMRTALTTPKAAVRSPEVEILEKRLEEEKRNREEVARKQDEDRKEERRRYDEDRKETQRRMDEDRKMMMEGMTKLGESIRSVAERPLPPKDDTMATILTVMAPVLTALITRPTPPPPDNTSLIVEMNKATTEAARSSMQMLTTAMSRPPDTSNEKMFEAMIKLTGKQDSVQQTMINGMMQSLLEKDKGQVLTPEILMNIQERAEKRIERMMGLGQAGQQQGGGEEGDEGYDPALGFMGNAGKMLFASLKALMDSAASNPALMELAMKVIGSRNPTDQQLAQTAHQWEVNGVPPAMMAHIPQAQLPMNGYAPTNQAAIPMSQPPMQQQRVAQPQRAMPPPMPGQQVVVNPQPVATQQQAAIDELEGSSTGLPSNGDPEPVQPMTAEEMAEENLRDAVTQTIEIICGEVLGKPNVRVWPEDATAHWNKDFIQQIVNCPTDSERLKIIGTRCDLAVAQKLQQLWVSDPAKNTVQGEYNIFVRELHRFVEMNLPRPVVAAPVIPAATVPPAPGQ